MQTTAAGTQYNTANAVTQGHTFEEETIAAIANLAIATSLDRVTTAQLSATNAQLTAELKKTQERLAQALEKIVEISTGCTPLPQLPQQNQEEGKKMTGERLTATTAELMATYTSTLATSAQHQLMVTKGLPQHANQWVAAISNRMTG